jgi:hypothetical protein
MEMQADARNCTELQKSGKKGFDGPGETSGASPFLEKEPFSTRSRGLRRGEEETSATGLFVIS